MTPHSIDPVTGKPLKRTASVYTVMLGVTVIVLIVCCLLLYFEWKAYDFEIRARLTQNQTSGTVEGLAAHWNWSVPSRPTWV